MKTLCYWVWGFTGLLFIGFIINILFGIAFFEDIFVSNQGWGWMIGLWLSQFANILCLVMVGLRCKQAHSKTSHLYRHDC